ncbi:MAG: lamin tail domain-containing protein [Deltaproteobacteria bacterium]|nr:lamin tail domain-containing protein [Deltaproteobacteria bacterium]
MYSLRLSSIVGLLALLLVGTTGCPKDEPITQPDIVSFTSDLTTITGAGSATLSWQTTGASAVSMVDGAGQAVDLAGAAAAAGSVDVLLDTAGAHTFTLTATGEEGSTPATASLTIMVEANAAPQITAFAAAPASINSGGTSTLSWATTGADSLSLVDDAGNTIDLSGQAVAAGSVAVTPAADITYTLTATGPGGTATATTTVTVLVVPTILTFTSDATGPIVGGAPVILSWTTSGADSLTLADDAGNTIDVSGLAVAGDSVSVSPTVSATYTLTATNTNGNATATTSVDVLTAIISFTLTPSTARAGDTVTLDWQIGGASSGDITGPDGFSHTLTAGELAMGTTTVTAGSPGDFVLSATGPLNNDSWTEALAITTAPRIRTFTATPTDVTVGESTTLAWTVDGATTLALTDSLGNTIDVSALSVTADSASQTLTTSGTVTFTLTATNVDGNHVMTADVIVDGMPTIDTFAALPSRVSAGADTTLSWTTSNVTSVRLEENSVDLGIPATDLSGTHLATSLAADTTYVLYASNSAGFEVSSNLTVTVGAPLNVSFTASPAAAAPSDAITLQWVNEGGTTVTVNDGTTDVCLVNVPADVAAGSCSVTAPAALGTYTYTLTVADGAGGSDTATADLFVSDGPIIRDFSASATGISEGDTLTLSWIVDNDPAGTTPTLSLTDDQGNTYDVSGLDPNLASGDLVGLTAGTYVFTLGATTGAGTDAVATVTVTVVALPTIVTFDANPRSLDTQGGTVVPTTDLSWTTTDGVSAELRELDAIGQPLPTPVHVAANQGEVDAYTLAGHSLTGTTVFQLHVENSVGGFVESIVTVVVDGPVVTSFVATLGGNPVTEIVAGETVDLTWTTDRADTAALEPAAIQMTTGQYVDISATGTALTFSSGDDTTTDLVFPAGFAFPFYGTDRTQVRVSTNGFITFDMAASSNAGNDPIPDTTSPNGGVIAAFWDDLHHYTTGVVYWELVPDAAGPDALIIQAHNVHAYSGETTTDFNFQYVLWDNGDLAVNYATMSSTADQADADGSGATIGFEDDTGTRGVQISYNSPVAGGLTNTGWLMQLEVPINGSTPASPMADTTYTLTASSASGSDSAAVTLVVHPAAQISASGFTPAQPQEGQVFDITWTTVDATQVVVTDAVGNVLCTVTAAADVASGTCAVTEATAATYDYTVTATGALPRDTTSATVSAQVYPALVINGWTATDGTNTEPDELFVAGGTSVDLAWDTAGAAGLAIVASPGGNITPAGWGATGTLTVNPAVTTLYTLSISDDAAFGAGSRIVTDTVRVYVDAAQVTSFGASTTQTAAGASVDLSWTTTGTVDALTVTPSGVTTTTGNTFTSIVGLAGAVDISPTNLNGGYTNVALPTFAFPFDGQSFTNFRVSSTGFVSFNTADTASHWANDPIPSSDAPNGGVIAAFWDDITGTTGTTTVTYLTAGIPGSQTLTFQWTGFKHYNAGGNMTFQLVLHESGSVEVNYLDMTATDPADDDLFDGSSATVGWENIAGNDGVAFVYNTASPALIANGVKHVFDLSPLPANGTTTVTPAETTTYEICATGGGHTDCQTVTVYIVVPGDLMISELMVDPAVAGGEWFEVYNNLGGDIDIEGWVLKDDGGQTHTIASGGPLLVPANGFLVLAANADSGTNGGLTPAYAYGAGLTLDSPADQLVLEFDGVEIDRVSWDAAWTLTSGASLSFDLSQAGDPAANDTPLAWCTEGTSYGAGGAGSPGAAGGCFSFVTYSSTPGLAVPDNGATGSPCDSVGSAVDSFVVSETGLVLDVNVLVDVTHTWDSDLMFWLGFDNGGTPICVELSTGNGSWDANYTQTLFDDEATTPITSGSAPFTGAYQPEGLLSDFDGVSMNGTWTLYVADDASGDTGTLNEWRLTLSY